MTVLDYTAEQILAIDKLQPELLFTSIDSRIQERELKQLRVKWYPDRNKHPLALQVFQHLEVLKDQAKNKTRLGIWKTPNTLQLRDKYDGKVYEVRYIKEHILEIGVMYISHSLVTFLIDPAYRDLFDIGSRTIANLKYGSDRMEQEAGRYVPHVKMQFEIEAGPVMVCAKAPNLILLKDVFSHSKKLDEKPRHVAWILSTMYNLACYLEYSKLTHNAISMETYFISPEEHSGALIGGWWYATPVGQSLKALTQATLKSAPMDMISTKKADSRLDLELIGDAGREMLCGDAHKYHLLHKCGAPKPLIEWLMRSNMTSAVKTYDAWQKVLTDAFGPRRFVQMDLKFDDVYTENLGCTKNQRS